MNEEGFEQSDLVMRVATQVICHTLVNCQDLFLQERFAVAHAILQRVMTTHLCNHKLTTPPKATFFICSCGEIRQNGIINL